MGAEYSTKRDRHSFRATAKAGRGIQDTSENYLIWLLVTNYEQTKETFENLDEPMKQNILSALDVDEFFGSPMLGEIHINTLSDLQKDELSEQI